MLDGRCFGVFSLFDNHKVKCCMMSISNLEACVKHSLKKANV